MVHQNLVVEARSLTRMACENLICVGALAAHGREFVNDLVLDEATSRKRKGKLLLEHAESEDLGDVTHKLRGYLAELERKHPKTKGLTYGRQLNRAPCAKRTSGTRCFRATRRTSRRPRSTATSLGS